MHLFEYPTETTKNQAIKYFLAHISLSFSMSFCSTVIRWSLTRTLWSPSLGPITIVSDQT